MQVYKKVTADLSARTSFDALASPPIGQRGGLLMWNLVVLASQRFFKALKFETVQTF